MSAQPTTMTQRFRSGLRWAGIVFGTVLALSWWLTPPSLAHRACRAADFKYVLGWRGTTQLPGRAVTRVQHLERLSRSPARVVCRALVTRRDGSRGWYVAVITGSPGNPLISVAPRRRP